MTAQCGRCGADIIWTLTANGKRTPVDAAPAEDGNLFVFAASPDPDDPMRAIHALGKDDRAVKMRREGQPRYVSHFVTCPDAPQHRKSR